jgi:hypothetical protein
VGVAAVHGYCFFQANCKMFLEASKDDPDNADDPEELARSVMLDAAGAQCLQHTYAFQGICRKCFLHDYN